MHSKRIRNYICDGTPEAVVNRYARLSEEAKNLDFGEFDRSIVVLDTEATGLSVNNDELTQIAAARLEKGEITEWFVTFVNPGKPIPDDVAHLTDIHDEDVAAAPSPSEALAALVEFVGDAKILAHNAEFDRSFTTKHPAGYPLLENIWLDSLDLARIALPRMKSHRLIDLVEAFNAPRSTHRADDDVAATCALYRILLAAVASMPKSLVREISLMATVQDWPTVAVFKYFASEENAGESALESLSPAVHAEYGQQLNREVSHRNVSRETFCAEGERAQRDFGEEGADSEGQTAPRALTQGALPGFEGVSIRRFSMRNLRTRRLGNTALRPKRDAKDIEPIGSGCVEEPAFGSGQIRITVGKRKAPATFDPAIFGAGEGGSGVFDLGEPSFGESGSGIFGSNAGVFDAAAHGSGESGFGGPRSSVFSSSSGVFGSGELGFGGFGGSASNVGGPGGMFHVKHSAMKYPSEGEIRDAFSAKGIVGARYENYEARGEQVEMALAIGDALARERNLAVEAGTGVGKSMAYLVPLALLATANDINVGVATKTNALLDQLVYQELPKLKESLAQRGVELTYTALKGFSHYPCLRRIERVVQDGPRKRLVGTKECSQAPSLAALLSFIEQTEYDDLDTLKIDYRALPRKMVTTTSHECLRKKCPFFGASCFVHGSRRKAEASHVVVTNHSLLFCDAAAENRLLPPIRYWAVDEAHGAEAEARRAFSKTLAADELKALAQKVSAAEASRNVFSRVERVAAPADGSEAALLFATTGKAKEAGAAFAGAAGDFCDHLKDLLAFDSSKKSKGYESVELWVNEEIRRSEAFRGLVGFGRTMSDCAGRLISACQNLVSLLEAVERAESVQHEVAVVAMELKDLVQTADAILFSPSERYVYAATLSKRGDRPIDKLEALLFNVGDMLGESFYANTKSVTFASATLAVGSSFASFKEAMGLNRGGRTQSSELALPSSYDFNRQMTIYVVKDMPEPNDPQYLPELQRLLTDVHLAQGGSMLTLFTNRREMERCFDEVAPKLKERGLRLVCQKWGVSVKGLRDDFLKDESLSLFALKSFWEGFDAPGATLRGVVIPKLPFAKPTDPLSCERSARDDYAWRRYVLPAAILETKQAAGRLIRRASDRGVLILADRRLLSKSYGRVFLNSMPSRNVQILPAREIARRLRASGESGQDACDFGEAGLQ